MGSVKPVALWNLCGTSADSVCGHVLPEQGFYSKIGSCQGFSRIFGRATSLATRRLRYRLGRTTPLSATKIASHIVGEKSPIALTDRRSARSRYCKCRGSGSSSKTGRRDKSSGRRRCAPPREFMWPNRAIHRRCEAPRGHAPPASRRRSCDGSGSRLRSAHMYARGSLGNSPNSSSYRRFRTPA